MSSYIPPTKPVFQLTALSVISLGKYGSFPANYIIGRPYNFTYELLDKAAGQRHSELRIVPASELHADVVAEEQAAAANPSSEDNVVIGGDGVEFELVGENGEVLMKSNRETIDDAARQTLTMEEIEELKREGTGAGKDLIAKLMLSHTALDEKSSFSLAKYKLTKTKKYLKRFTLLPLDVAMLLNYLVEDKDATKVLEMREEMLALVGSWANVHYAEDPNYTDPEDTTGGGRWLVVDETGGLLVAAVAERMGVLHAPPEPETVISNEDEESEVKHPERPPFATTNTITLLHNNAQPNLSLLKYFQFISDIPAANHPLTTHLLSLSWLQLINPHLDTTYATPPPPMSPTTLEALKSSKRGTYHRKRRRYLKTRHIVDSTLRGDFTGLVIASSLDPASILRRTLPLLRGGAPISIYSPTIEPLVVLSDLYSTSRKTAFINAPPAELDGLSKEDYARWGGNEDFPLNPTLVLGPSVQTARKRDWQVLPGRTHPRMTMQGGAEGYLWTGIKVCPAEGKVEARGKFVKRKAGVGEETNGEKKLKVEGLGTPEATADARPEEDGPHDTAMTGQILH